MSILIKSKNVDTGETMHFASYEDAISIENLPNGTYELEIFKKNHQRIHQTVEVKDNLELNLNFEPLPEYTNLLNQLSGKIYPTTISLDGRGVYGSEVETPIEGEYVKVLGSRSPDDLGTMIYKIVKEEDVPTDNFSQRTSIELTNRGLWAIPQYVDNFIPFENSPDKVEEMIGILKTWLGNNNMFTYGTGDSKNWLYTGLETKGTNGKHEVMCSTYALIAMFGIELNNSRFKGKIGNYSKIGWDMRSLFWKRNDVIKDTWLINDITKLADEFGWFFKVNSDYSNIKRGDILVQSNQTSDGWYPYYNITHVVIYLGNNQYMQISNGDLNNPITINNFDEYDMKNRTIGAIRFPLSNVNWNTNFK